MQKTLIIAGIIILIIGFCWPWVSKLPLGRLPGDIFINRENIKVFIPVTSMILVSLVLSILVWLFKK